MIALNKCKWIFEISSHHFTQEQQFMWVARTKTMDKEWPWQFANGGVGTFRCVRIFNTSKEIRKHINNFVKVNKIKEFRIKKAKKT